MRIDTTLLAENSMADAARLLDGYAKTKNYRKADNTCEYIVDLIAETKATLRFGKYDHARDYYAQYNDEWNREHYPIYRGA